MILIGLTGPAGVGKTTAAMILAEQFGYALIGFADPIREFVLRLYPNWSQWHLGAGKDAPDEAVGLTPRAAMCLAGDYGRSIKSDVYLQWAEAWVGQVAQRGAPGVVIHDVRTEMEADWLREGPRWSDAVQRALLIHLQRRGVEFRLDHLTERGVAAKPGDALVANPGTLHGLRGELLAELAKIRRKSAA